jgi:hypothetical protein
MASSMAKFTFIKIYDKGHDFSPIGNQFFETDKIGIEAYFIH